VKLLALILLCAWAASAQEPSLKLGAAPTRAKTTNSSGATEGAKSVEKEDPEYEKLIELDESVLNEVQKMEKDFAAFQEKGAAGSKAALAGKINQRLDTVKKAYNDFLEKHPDHVEALLAYGSFLNEIGEEEEAITQWEKARSLDPKNPSPWNNLANVYAHIGPIKKGFQYYERAIELNPQEPVYLQNLATVTYLFRKDAAEMYRIDEEAVFNKALDLYRRAMKLDPSNILLATDYAQSFYGIRPMRVEDALAAWNHALTLAKSQAEREGIYIHLARVELNSGRFPQAQQHLNLVQDPELQDMRKLLQKNLEKKKAEAEKKTAEETASNAPTASK
jgi:tetratricopeptide (TPR) repeat protein